MIDRLKFINVAVNIIKNVKQTPLKSYSTGQGIYLQAVDSSSQGNIIENNLVLNCENAGIFISANNNTGVVSDNIFRNNIVYNCGTKQDGIALEFEYLRGKDLSKTYNNVFNNNWRRKYN